MNREIAMKNSDIPQPDKEMMLTVFRNWKKREKRGVLLKAFVKRKKKIRELTSKS